MMKKYVSFILLILTGMILNSCEILLNCIEGDGISSTEERAVSSFTGVRCNSDYDVVLMYDENSKVIIEADDNLQQYIRAYVEDGNLILETDQGRCLQPQNRILVTVYCPYIETVVLSGSGDVDVLNFSADYFNVNLKGSGDIDVSRLNVAKSLEINLSGSGDISMEGKSAEGHYYLSGSGDIRAEDLKVNNCDITLSGSGDIHAQVYNSLKIVLSGSGSVYYYGDPVDVEDRVTGSGDIIKR